MVARSSRPLTSMPFDFALIELVRLISVIGLLDLIGLSDLDLIERPRRAARRQPWPWRRGVVYEAAVSQAPTGQINA